MIDSHPSAPLEVAFCCRCGGELTTREVAAKPRRACPACGFVHFIEPKVGVGMVLIEAGRLLLVQRAKPPEKGKWSLPAGYLDSGDDPEQTARREALEETNLDVVIDGLVGVYHNPIEQGGASVFILYRATRRGGELRAGDDAAAAAFFSLDALPELAFNSTIDTVNRLLASRSA